MPRGADVIDRGERTADNPGADHCVLNVAAANDATPTSPRNLSPSLSIDAVGLTPVVGAPLEHPDQGALNALGSRGGIDTPKPRGLIVEELLTVRAEVVAPRK
jgi:hypothetical protein